MENWYKVVLVSVLALATLIGVMAGRAQSTQSAPAFPTPVPTGITASVSGQIQIFATSFTPSTLTVHVGQKVTWLNQDTRPHGPVADNLSFSSDALSPGQQFTWTPSKPGTYSYADFVDSNLSGMIIVRP